jgi:large subunit ribosomal protein L5
MHYLEDFYIKNLKYDLINKFFYKNIKKLPSLKKIVLNFGCKTTNIKTLAANLLALELLAGKRGSLRTAKQPNLALRIKKGNPVGCILTLNKTKLNFISKILTETLTKIKQFDGLKLKCEKNCLSYTIKNSFNFTCLEDHYYLFNNLSNLNITIITNSSKKEETLFVLKALQLPLKNK